MMRHGFIAESANIEELDPEVADAPIVRSRIDNAKIDVVMSNSFGFGGTNAYAGLSALQRLTRMLLQAHGTRDSIG